jgi:hypothetical protein
MTYTEAELVVRNVLWHAKQVGHVETSPALVALDEMRREYENAEKRCETLTEHLAAANDLWEDHQSRLDETRELLNDKAARLAEAERLLRDVEDRMDGGGADRCAAIRRMQQEVTLLGNPSDAPGGLRVWAWVVVSCNRKVGHSGKHAYRWKED